MWKSYTWEYRHFKFWSKLKLIKFILNFGGVYFMLKLY